MKNLIVVNEIQSAALWRQLLVGYAGPVIAQLEKMPGYHAVIDLVREVEESGESAEGAVELHGEVVTIFVCTPHYVCLE